MTTVAISVDMHTEQLVGSEASVRDKRNEPPFQTYFWLSNSIYFLTELGKFMFRGQKLLVRKLVYVTLIGRR